MHLPIAGGLFSYRGTCAVYMRTKNPWTSQQDSMNSKDPPYTNKSWHLKQDNVLESVPLPLMQLCITPSCRPEWDSFDSPQWLICLNETFCSPYFLFCHFQYLEGACLHMLHGSHFQLLDVLKTSTEETTEMQDMWFAFPRVALQLL